MSYLQISPALLQATRNAYAYPAIALTGTLSELTQIEFESTSKLDMYLNRLLRSEEDSQAVIGYASVLFWGHVSGQDGRLRAPRAHGRVRLALNGRDRTHRGSIQRMRGVSDFGIDVVAAHIREATQSIAANDYAWALQALNNIPQLQIAFSSKLCAFIDPTKCGVVDSVIADKFPQFGFELAKGFIKNTSANRARYTDYCMFLQSTAQELNSVERCKKWTDRDGVQHSWRALDVERALYT
ncbi:hypothetical protein JYG33_05155 [Alcaligenes sp. SORT26]|uniref:8-oxoguanine DNA glycosylase OGG fold protein n=1 Tax=Alcaligenes sp. SORT26 TaxID=2813780 RepID=UPI001A9EE2DB|nr:hypothetical protein [Alcaligenes sp. SORT26]QTC00858.1 hypothetical protein JYG33_05155 [Alcaligenes sp. SORT26]